MSRIKDYVQEKSSEDGLSKGNVYGTYVHGIFDKEEVTTTMIRAIAKHKGIDPDEMEGVDLKAFKETQYDLLADSLRKHLDMKKIYEIMDRGITD